MLPTRSFIAMLMWTQLLMLDVVSSRADEVSQATSSRAARKEATDAIPLARMNKEAQSKVVSVLNNTSVYRRMPANRILCDPDMHNFMVRYPEIMVGIWKVMGITQVDATRIEDYCIQASDGMGTTSTVELLYGTRNLHVFFGQGTYEGPLFRNQLSGSCILVLRSDFGQTRDGEPIVVDRLDVFLRVDNIGVKLLAKALHTLVGKTADMNFVESTNFVGKVSETAEVNGTGLIRLTERIQGLQPAVKTAFQRVIQQASQRYAARLEKGIRQPAVQPPVPVRPLSSGSTTVSPASSRRPTISRAPPRR